MIIAKNKVSECAVILPENPTKTEEFAYQELNFYLKKICGAEFGLGLETEKKIVIGNPNRNDYAKKIISTQEFQKKVPGPEGFMIKSEGDTLLIAGSDLDGNGCSLIYAVYELLERYLGCSLGAYSNSEFECGEYVPSVETLEIPDVEYIKESCDLQYRTAIVQYSAWAGNPDHDLNKKFISWLSKNRYNRILTWSSIYEGFKKNGVLEEAEKRGIKFSVGHHEAINLFLPYNGNEYFSEKYSETHPEFYKLKSDGNRYSIKNGDFSGQLILCMRDEECINEFSKNMIKWLELNKNVDIINLWPSDGIDEGCQCEKCKNHSKSDNYTHFVNKVAQNVTRIMPNIKIDRIVYNDLVECPDESIDSSIIIDESVWLNNKLRTVGKPDGSGLIGTYYEDVILEWKSKGADVVFYDYLMGVYNAKQRYMPMADEIQSICKEFINKQIMGLGTQIEVYNLWNNIFNFYTYGRTAYDVSLSFEDNLKKFIKIFGKGAKYVEEIIKYCEEVLDGQEEIMLAGKFLIENVDKSYIYDLYEKALNEAEEAYERNCIRLMRMAFRYSDLEVSNLPEKNRVDIMTESMDENGELWYMNEKFDSFVSNKEGFGIAVPVLKSEKEFAPDKWYIFE